MKKALLIPFLFATIFCLGQDYYSEILKNTNTTSLQVNTKEKYGYLFLEQPYAKSHFINDGLFQKLDGAQIESITLCYSKFQQSKDYDQNGLNFQRYKRLLQKLKTSNISPYTKWGALAQSANSKEEASKLFHGFIIQYKPKPTKETVKIEQETLRKMLSGTYVESPMLIAKPAPEKKEAHKEEVNEEERTFLFTESTHSLPVDTSTVTSDTSRSVLDSSTPVWYTPATYSNWTPPKTTIHEAFVRNKWKNIHLVIDVTGSMYPYTYDILTWLKLQEKNYSDKIKSVTYFNDGNFKADYLKKTGSVGGIYNVSGEIDYNNIESTAFTCMRNGGGGDAPENNIEAVLKIEKHNKDIETIVMIADNWATPRDMSLLPKVKTPIKVVVCGVTNNLINTAYLKIAKETGGTVHTVEDDVFDLASMVSGETITILGVTYKLKDKEFFVVSKKETKKKPLVE